MDKVPVTLDNKGIRLYGFVIYRHSGLLRHTAAGDGIRLWGTMLEVNSSEPARTFSVSFGWPMFGGWSQV